MYQRSCTLDPFDFSDTWVSMHRARNFIGHLDSVGEWLVSHGRVYREWWPVNRAEMIETIKREQEVRQATAGGDGDLVAGAGRSSSSSSSRIKKKTHDAAPVALGGGQNNLAKPSSSNKRKAEDSSSTKTTTELPASSTEISDIKIKRQRKVE